jgi:equilibrative nucleoside transporter 1/2/3
MMGAGDYVEEGEREAAGSFMAINLVAGLMTGSLLSFAASAVH